MPRLIRRTWCSAAALSLAGALSSHAGASPLFELTGSQIGTGSFNARVTGASAASTYFNPALLAHAPSSVDVGFMVLSDQISMKLDGRTGGIVPERVGNRGSIFQEVDGKLEPIDNATVPTEWLENGCTPSEDGAVCGDPRFGARPRQGESSSGDTRGYVVLGLVNQILDEHLVLGFYALLPVGNFTTANSFYNDEREQFFSNSLHPEMYSDRLTSTSLAFGLGSQIVERLSVGVSATLNLTNEADARTYVRDPIDYNELFVSTNVEVSASVSPHFGVVYDALDWLRLSGTVHSEQKFTIDTGISAALPSGQESDTTRTSVHSILPWTFGFGTAVDLNRGATHEFGVAGSLRYALWSNYRDRHGERPDHDGQGLGWSDVFSGSVGVRHHSGSVDTFLDLNYQPTPVPKQIGRKNYVDNDRVGAALGGQYAFSLAKLNFRAGGQLQAHHLLHRYQKKDDALIEDELPDDAVDGARQPIPGAGGLQTNNPGWPGFASDGWILGGSLTLSLLY
ncbi:MAG TPA: hypothetical protein VI072_10560 [Polyangiaceae bacterium]